MNQLYRNSKIPTKQILFVRLLFTFTFAKHLFFGKYFKKKLLNIFSNFFFYLKVQSFRLIMDNNFSPMAASAGHAVAYTIGTIFKHIIDCVQLYLTNGFKNIAL